MVSVELLVVFLLFLVAVFTVVVVDVVVVEVEVEGCGGEGVVILADPSKLVAPGLTCKILLGLRPVAMSL